MGSAARSATSRAQRGRAMSEQRNGRRQASSAATATSGRATGEPAQDDPFVIAGVELSSRLILGTGGAPSLQVVDEALAASRTAMCTVAMRRGDPRTSGSILDVIDRRGVRILPNTAACRTAREAG